MSSKRAGDAASAAADPQDLLIELGCEELPPKALDDIRDAFFNAVTAGLNRENFDFDLAASRAYSTPRRLALVIRQVAGRQPDQQQEKRGPAVAAAFDASGKPTGAALGFARSVGQDVDALQRLETDKGTWLVARVDIAGKELADILFPLLEQTLRQLPVPRPMRWASHDFSFVRPVHWLVVMHGDCVLTGQLFGHQAGNTTRGHRVHAPGPHPLAHAADYLQVLHRARVLADQEVRKSSIRQQALDLDPAVRIDAELLSEVNNLVEWPVAVLCSFDETFLELPHEALVASMQDHQKFFPVLAATGSSAVTNRFVVIANLDSSDFGQVRAGFERVIRPRLADARFFLEQDQKQAIEAYTAALDTVVFQDKIGTLGDKVSRITSLSQNLAKQLGFDPAACARAAQLAKCDLMSLMVGEFPELQGIIGRHYARFWNEPPAVATAIEEHYLPRFAGDGIPASSAGQVVGLADRVDTLMAIFSAGLRPTGNKDPFALRRSALGLVRILLEARLELPLTNLLALAANALTGQGLAVAPEVLQEVREFIVERARNHFREAGHGAERINAALNSNWETFPDLHARLDALAEFMGEESGVSLAAANKRIGNILRKSESQIIDTIDDNILMFAEEQELYRQVVEAETDLQSPLQVSDYRTCLVRLAQLRPGVDAFFDAVMVMDDDLRLRNNRLALLSRLKSLFDQIADLSVLA